LAGFGVSNVLTRGPASKGVRLLGLVRAGSEPDGMTRAGWATP
jgi:hypothetical protein